VARIANILDDMRNNPKGVRFRDLCQVCDHYFGQARQRKSNHRICPMPWKGDPRINIQSDKGMAKAYQVKQVLKAIKRLKNENTTKD